MGVQARNRGGQLGGQARHCRPCLYLADGGDTLLNRVVIRKFGLVVSGTTEYFRRGAGPTASVGPLR